MTNATGNDYKQLINAVKVNAKKEGFKVYEKNELKGTHEGIDMVEVDNKNGGLIIIDSCGERLKYSSELESGEGDVKYFMVEQMEQNCVELYEDQVNKEYDTFVHSVYKFFDYDFHVIYLK